MNYILDIYDYDLFTVETGVDNLPACKLYKTLGFNETKQWDTDFGIKKIGFEKMK